MFTNVFFLLTGKLCLLLINFTQAHATFANPRKKPTGKKLVIPNFQLFFLRSFFHSNFNYPLKNGIVLYWKIFRQWRTQATLLGSTSTALSHSIAIVVTLTHFRETKQSSTKNLATMTQATHLMQSVKSSWKIVSLLWSNHFFFSIFFFWKKYYLKVRSWLKANYVNMKILWPWKPPTCFPALIRKGCR